MTISKRTSIDVESLCIVTGTLLVRGQKVYAVVARFLQNLFGNGILRITFRSIIDFTSCVVQEGA